MDYYLFIISKSYYAYQQTVTYEMLPVPHSKPERRIHEVLKSFCILTV